jgi:hypothetical protein
MASSRGRSQRTTLVRSATTRRTPRLKAEAQQGKEDKQRVRQPQRPPLPRMSRFAWRRLTSAERPDPPRGAAGHRPSWLMEAHTYGRLEGCLCARAWRGRGPGTCSAVEDDVRDGKLIVVVSADQVGLLLFVVVPWLFSVGGLLRLGCVRCHAARRAAAAQAASTQAARVTGRRSS